MQVRGASAPTGKRRESTASLVSDADASARLLTSLFSRFSADLSLRVVVRLLPCPGRLLLVASLLLPLPLPSSSSSSNVARVDGVGEYDAECHAALAAGVLQHE